MTSAHPLEAADRLGRNPETEAILNELRSMRMTEFDKAVLEWALHPDRESDKIFASPPLIKRTVRALGRLQDAPLAGASLLGGGRELDAKDRARLQGIREKVSRHALRFGVTRPQFSPAPKADGDSGKVTTAQPLRAVSDTEPKGRQDHPRKGSRRRLGDIKVNAQGVREIALPNLESLPPKAAARVAQLRYYFENDKGTWEDAVYLWATSGGTWEDDRAFQSTELAFHTGQTLVRLRKDAQTQQAQSPSREEQEMLRLDIKMLGETRNQLKPFINLAMAQRARSKDEELALKVLRRVYYKDYVEILADIKAKKGKRTAEQQAKARKWAALEERVQRKIEEDARPPLRRRNRRKR
jgi:hypothetical protein